MPAPGDSITPTIRLVREIGAGGMGSVWVADHAALQTQVVVKFMLARLATDVESRLRFSREAAANSNVKSPHVVQVLDHGVAPDGSPFIVMELLEGCDLEAHLKQQRIMPLIDVELVVSQTCKALARAHERGIVHRDIKPQNIFLTHVGGGEVFVKVLDFGIAKAVDLKNGLGTSTKTGAMMGTPFYMSPEQITGAKGVDHRTDLWALGVVAFECLVGQRPFDADTIGGLAVCISNNPIPCASSLNPALPLALDAWFDRACARSLSERFGTATEMAEALRTAVSGQAGQAVLANSPFRAPPQTVPTTGGPSLAHPLAATTGAPLSHGRGQTPRRRIGRWIGGIVLVGLALLVFGVVSVVAIVRDSGAPQVEATFHPTPSSPPPTASPPPSSAVAAEPLPLPPATAETPPVPSASAQPPQRPPRPSTSAKPMRPPAGTKAPARPTATTDPNSIY